MGLWKRNGIYWYDFTIKGRRLRGSTEQRDKYLAGLVLNDKMSAARANGVDSILREAPVLKDFSVEFLKWVEEANSIEEHTRRYYRTGWNMLKDSSIAQVRMDAITNQMCERLTFPGGPANANRALRTLRRMLSSAKEARKLFGDLPKIELRKEWARSIAMTQADAQAISAHMEGDARDVFDVMRDATPMRPMEAFSMRWEYLNFLKSVYLNPKGKSKAARRPIILFDLAMNVLKRRHMEQGSPAEGWIFPSQKSETGHIVSIDTAFTTARDKSGLPKGMVLYTIRHGRATDLAKIMTLKELMQVGGWDNANVALGYQHPEVDDLKARLEAAKPNGRIQ